MRLIVTFLWHLPSLTVARNDRDAVKFFYCTLNDGMTMEDVKNKASNTASSQKALITQAILLLCMLVGQTTTTSQGHMAR